MRSTDHSTRCFALAAAVAAALPACSEGAAGESARGEPAKISACLSVQDVSTALGTPVRFVGSHGGTWMTCMYELTGRYRGVFIELSTQPATRAGDVYAELRRAAKGMNGADATPDTVMLGEGGLAFGSGSMSRAAVVSKGRLYQANMQYMGFESVGDQKDAMIKVLELAVR